MKIRAKQVTAIVLLLLAGTVSLVFFASNRSANETASEEDFLDEIHRIEETAPASEEVGQLPGAGADDSLVPVIELEPAHLDLGLVSNKTRTPAVVKVHNRGKAVLTVSSVKTSCACTQGEMENANIAPGETGTLRIVFDPFRVYGFRSDKTLTLYTNDPETGSIEAKVSAQIEAEFSLEPWNVEFGDVEKGTPPPQQTLLLKQLEDEPIVITRVEPIGDMTVASFDFARRPESEWAQPGHAEYTIQVTLAADLIPGEQRQNFKVHLECKRVPQILCEVAANVKASYAVNPKTLVIASTVGPEYGAAIVSADRPIEIAGAKSSTPHLTVTVTPGDTPNTFRVTPAVAPGTPDGDYRESVLFDVLDAGQTYVNRIPVHYTVRSAAAPPVNPNEQ